jgi:hypothetical protein
VTKTCESICVAAALIILISSCLTVYVVILVRGRRSHPARVRVHLRGARQHR